ncbi:MAG TPA: hypothetical protein VG125_04045 [Pirellulales bacterium]|jgi:hypothetical protein|nr:hypothetical protein [Pirellulales bacterium]
MYANAIVEVWQRGEEGIGQIQFGVAGGDWQCHAWMCAPAESGANLERIAATISQQLADGCEQGAVGDFTWQHVLSA